MADQIYPTSSPTLSARASISPLKYTRLQAFSRKVFAECACRRIAQQFRCRLEFLAGSLAMDIRRRSPLRATCPPAHFAETSKLVQFVRCTSLIPDVTGIEDAGRHA